jgi:subtilisin-like proprotein convertase family protein
VSLAAPGADTVVLHDRAGASADNLIKAYTSEDNPILAALVGGQSHGDWTLKVADLARRDLGTLRRWSLEIELEAAPRVTRGEAAPALKIPDDDPNGVSSAIAILQSGTVQGVEVGVDLTHTYVGDLLVELMSPMGQRAILHDRLGGSSDNLLTTYDSVSTPSLETLIGQPIQGSWVIRVTDLAGQDVGKLNRWSIELIYGD